MEDLIKHNCKGSSKSLLLLSQLHVRPWLDAPVIGLKVHSRSAGGSRAAWQPPSCEISCRRAMETLLLSMNGFYSVSQ